MPQLSGNLEGTHSYHMEMYNSYLRVMGTVLNEYLANRRSQNISGMMLDIPNLISGMAAVRVHAAVLLQDTQTPESYRQNIHQLEKRIEREIKPMIDADAKKIVGVIRHAQRSASPPKPDRSVNG